ncbi:ORF6N domain-containing protein [Maribacter halichondriae]|uniref:ORF6N domain-containing protein n=1 Tax=Maribacter halichondriae TaxID=2980554 RepID=UPI002359566A|nr:ORF6N domain-containing protein [Maribacter sp. Hal144]
MSKDELEHWRSQIVTSNSDRMGLRYAPFCFTEQGVTMLSCILNSDRAIAMNIPIIRVFTKMREVLNETVNLKLEIEQIKKKLSDHGRNIELVFDYLDELIRKKENKEPRKKIGYRKD